MTALYNAQINKQLTLSLSHCLKELFIDIENIIVFLNEFRYTGELLF